jgi:signal transduction histidine kinase
MHQKQWPQALPPLLRAERLYAAAPVTPAPVWADILTLIGETYMHNGHPEQTERYITRAMRICRQARLRAEEMDALEGLANLAEARGDFPTAFRYQRRLWQLSDTLHTEAAARGLAEMQTKYDTERKDAQSRIQALRLREQRLLVRKRNAQLIAAGAALLLMLVAGWGLYRRRALRQQLELEQQRQQLERQRAAAVLAAEENERRRIGSDLHDGLGQLLTAAKLNLHALEQQLGDRLDGQQVLLDNAVAVVDESFREVRSISHNLMPNALIKRGLVQAVRDFLDKLPSGNGLRVEVEVFGLENARLDPTVESVLFRVIQELVQNIVKHAQASEVTVQLVQGEAELTVVVEDNGRGFDPKALPADAGIGLRNVETRMAYLGGHAYFDATPGRGTTVTLEVPLAAPAA